VAATNDPRPNHSTPDMALRRANVLAQLDLERMRAGPVPRPDRFDEFDRRLERIEAAIYVLTGQLAVVESLAGLAQEQAESVAGAW
jgi:hypothetical protein